jgi:hypothetical protein
VGQGSGAVEGMGHGAEIVSALEIIVGARELLADGPHRWIKGFGAVNKDGGVVFDGSSDACRWCMSGALYASYYRQRKGNFYDWCDARDVILTILREPGMVTFNDDPNTTYEMVLAAFDKAIEKAKEQQA